MTKQHKTKPVTAMTLAVLAMTLAACGGGGGGGGGTNPPPPPAGVTYTLTLTDVTLTDRLGSTAVTATGLPVSGAVATRNP